MQWRWAYPVAAAVLFLDLATKGAVQASFSYGERIPLASFVNLIFVMNPGAAFSFLADAGGWQRPSLLVIGAAASATIAYMLWRNRMDRLSAFGLSGILGGALGNVIDRARHGAVVDWLDFHVAGWHWPAFNIADIGISAGAAALIAASLVSGRTKDGRRKAR